MNNLSASGCTTFSKLPQRNTSQQSKAIERQRINPIKRLAGDSPMDLKKVFAKCYQYYQLDETQDQEEQADSCSRGSGSSSAFRQKRLNSIFPKGKASRRVRIDL